MLPVSSDEKKRVALLMKTVQSTLQAFDPNKESSLKQLDAALTKLATFLTHEAETCHGIDQLCLSDILDNLVSRMSNTQLELMSEISYVDWSTHLIYSLMFFDMLGFFLPDSRFLKRFCQNRKLLITCANPIP